MPYLYFLFSSFERCFFQIDPELQKNSHQVYTSIEVEKKESNERFIEFKETVINQICQHLVQQINEYKYNNHWFYLQLWTQLETTVRISSCLSVSNYNSMLVIDRFLSIYFAVKLQANQVLFDQHVILIKFKVIIKSVSNPTIFGGE